MMNAYELLKTNKWLLEALNKASLEVYDLYNIPIIDDYKRLRAEGHKTTYIMQYLSDEYNISERQAYRVIKRLTMEVKL